MKQVEKIFLSVLLFVLAAGMTASAQEPDQVSSTYLQNAGDKSGAVAPRATAMDKGMRTVSPASTR